MKLAELFKIAERGWNRKEGRGNKDLKKGGKLGQGLGASKRGTGIPLRTMVLEAAKLAYANKTKESITSKKLGSQDFWQIANSVLNKGKSATPLLFNGPGVLSSAKLIAENFSKNSNIDDSVTLYPFSHL